MIDTEPLGALTTPTVVTAPVLSITTLPPMLLMPVMVSAPVLVSATLPLPLLVAAKLPTRLPASLRVVPVCDWVLSAVARIGPLWVMAPAGALRLRLGTVKAGRFRLPLAWVILAPALLPKLNVPPVWLKLEFTVRLFPIFRLPPATLSPAAVSDARLVSPAAAS